MNNIKRVASVVALGALMSGTAQAQLSNTLYFHKYNYRSHQVNTAAMPEGKFYLGFPALSTIAFGVGNNGISFSDVIKNTQKNGKNTTVLFLDEAVNNGKEDFLNALNNNEHINFDFKYDIIDFGFKAGDNFITVNISARAEANAFVPKEVFEFAFDGMEADGVTDLDASDFSFNAKAYSEIGVGWIRQVSDNFSFGAKFKFLRAVGGFKTDFSKLNLTCSADEWVLSGTSDIYGSFPGLYVENNGNKLNKIDVEDDPDYAKGGGNGVAFDFGVNYKLTDKLTLSLNVADLGFINFKNDAIRINMTKDFVYNGGEFDIKNQEFSYSIENDFKEAVQGYNDESFNLWLTTKLYFGCEYALSKMFSVGLLSKTYFGGQHVWEDITVSGNFHPFRYISLTAAYNAINYQYNAFGLGATFNLGPIQLFASCDNIPFRFAKDTDQNIMIPSHLKYATVNFGMGFVFGTRKSKEQPAEDLDDMFLDEDPDPDFFDADGDGVSDGRDRCPETPFGIQVDRHGCPFDADKDGVPDYKDECPETPEDVQVDEKGCPVDADKDGVPDHLDECSDTPEGVQVDEKGCPLDEDKDGVPDYLDQCSNTPQGAQVDEKGCPLDTDGDGVPDYLDKCPTVKGLASNNGCPEVKQEVKQLFRRALNGIQFQSGKAVILRSSYSILDQIVNTMKTNPDYKLYISGHTDNVGNPDSNLKLSKDRANAVKDYLVKKGVDSSRLSADGFGDTKPIAPNNNSANRAKNRRVEFEVEF